MAQFKDGALTRGERGEGMGDAAGEFLIPGLALGVGMRALFADLESNVLSTSHVEGGDVDAAFARGPGRSAVFRAAARPSSTRT